MTTSLNLLIIVGIFSFILFFLFMKLTEAKKRKDINNQKAINKDNYTISALKEYISQKMLEITNSNLYLENLTEEGFKRRQRRLQELKDALKNCNTGDLSSKIYVREYIYRIFIRDLKFDETKVNLVIPFDNPSKMTAREKFETMLYLGIKKDGNKSLGNLIERFNFNKNKPGETYNVTAAEIDAAYTEVIRGQELQLEDKVRIVAQIVYSHYKGFGVVDEIRDMDIDGVSGGLNGKNKLMTQYMSNFEAVVKSNNQEFSSLESVWIMYRGDSIHLSFLSFEHEAELMRVTTNIYKYKYPGQLSESRPYIHNEMFDESRVLAIRPKMAESYAFFVRKKIESKLLELEELFPQKNNNLLIRTIGYLMAGERTTAMTGQQYSGKTTTLRAAIKKINPKYNLRVQETMFEANLRSVYDDRNILSFQETDNVTGEDGLNIGKKADGDVTIIGEVATAPVSAWAIESGQVASRFTIFTHHAKTTYKLVDHMSNALKRIGLFSDDKSAEAQVIDVLEFDVHMEHRIVERISEIVPIEYVEEAQVMEDVNSANTQEEKMSVLMDVMTTFFRQQTQRRQFTVQNIIEYRDGAYVAVNPISEDRQRAIEKCLTHEERAEFRAFIEEYWGKSA